jgi:SSS family solute:Na+ symporter
VVAILASRILDGKQETHSVYSVQGQKDEFARLGKPEKDNGWYLVPGKVDSVSWYLLVFFAVTVIFLYGFNAMIS